MHSVKGELDLYIYDKDGNLVKHHVQSNYDTIRARLNPSFSSTVNRITRLECTKVYKYPRPVAYDELVEVPLYLDEPLFAPKTIYTHATDDGYYALSYDKGSNWFVYDGNTWNPVVINSAADLRLYGMNIQTMENIPFDEHLSKYIDHVVILSTASSPNNIIYSHNILMKYDHSLLDPYYVRWIGDFPILSRYSMDTIPISTSMSGNVYTINVSNLSGVAPIEIDTIMTYVGSYIGTFTYVGLTVEVDQILTGTYTITVESDSAVYSKRTDKAEYIMWGTTSPSYNDGVSGGVRYHGSESRLGIYTYNGGPAENKWMYPFMPDRDFRLNSYSRSITSEFNSDREYGENYIDPDYNVISTGGVKIWSVNKDLLSNLSILPILYRYVFLSTGDTGVAEYLLFYKSRMSSLIHDKRWDQIHYDVPNDDRNRNYREIAVQAILKDPFNPMIWNYILYDNMDYDGKLIPRTAANPYHDLIVEVYDDHLVIMPYGQDPLFRLDANVDETFYLATLTYEDPTGRDLTLWSYNSTEAVTLLSSIPIKIERDFNSRSLTITVVGDLTERQLVGNVSSLVGAPESGYGLYWLLKVQNAKNGPWTTGNLLEQLKSLDDDGFLATAHADSLNPVDDVDKILDQIWDTRHLYKYGNIVTSNDAWGDTAIEFDGTGLIYLKDDRGAQRRSTRWDMYRPNVTTYLEFQPSVSQNSTLAYNRNAKYVLHDDNTLTIDTVYNSTIEMLNMYCTMIIH